MAYERVLLGDIGGTTARFSVLTGGALGPVEHQPVSRYGSLTDAIRDYLAGLKERAPLDAALLGVAGAIESGRGTLVNSQWGVDAAEIHAVCGIKSVHLINDFEAVAHALPHLTWRDVTAIAGGKPPLGESMAVLGPGTGLGMAGIVHRGDRMTVIPTEGGHATLPGTTPREDAVIAWLRDRFGHASAERALSGPGLENLHAAIAAVDGAAVPERTAVQITQLALDGHCPVCTAVIDMFCAMLGTVAGNLALMFRARGGVYIAGGIAPRIIELLARSEFRARFMAKGRFRSYLERVPVAVIVNPDAAFLGLRALALHASDSAFRQDET
ncbi:MAG: glucokinase [Bradyrhizobiaceae bacterium]|nr:glucokinase [Bradyrhizobiaceae bacterium]